MFTEQIILDGILLKSLKLKIEPLVSQVLLSRIWKYNLFRPFSILSNILSTKNTDSSTNGVKKHFKTNTDIVEKNVMV